MNYIQYESQNNDLLRAVSSGGHLSDSLKKCRPFDALLVPIQAAFEVRADDVVQRQFRTELRMRQSKGTGPGNFLSNYFGPPTGGEEVSDVPTTTDDQLSSCIRDILLTEEMLSQYVVRLDHRYGQSFTTAAGVKGRFGDQLEVVQLQGRASVTVLRHVVPCPGTVEQEGVSPETLNFFLIADVLGSNDDELLPTEDPASGSNRVRTMLGRKKVVKRLKHTQSVLGLSDFPENLDEEDKGVEVPEEESDPTVVVESVDASRGASHQDGEIKQGKIVAEQRRSTWGSWLLGLARTQPPPQALTAPSSTPLAADRTSSPNTMNQSAASEAATKDFSFKAFQEKMGHPASQPVVLMIRDFLDQVQQLYAKGADPSAQAGTWPQICPQDIHNFIEDCVEEMEGIELWRNGGKEGLSAALDGLEKYVCTKLFSKLFCQDDKELVQNGILERRLTAFQRCVTPQHLDALDITGTTEFSKGVEMLRKINSYKSPLDKVEVIAKCFQYLVAGIRITLEDQGTAQIVSGSVKEGSPKKSVDSIGADQILPCFMYCILVANPKSLMSNGKFIEQFRHPTRMSGEAGYFATTLLSVTQFWLQCNASDLRLSSSDFEEALRASRNSRTSGVNVTPKPPEAPSPASPVHTDPVLPESKHVIGMTKLFNEPPTELAPTSSTSAPPGVDLFEEFFATRASGSTTPAAAMPAAPEVVSPTSAVQAGTPRQLQAELRSILESNRGVERDFTGLTAPLMMEEQQDVLAELSRLQGLEKALRTLVSGNP